MPIDSNPLAADLGGVLTALDAEAGIVCLDFSPGPRYIQGNGTLQGGIVATMLDFAIAFAGLAALPDSRYAVTASLTVNMFKPALAGRYTVRAQLNRVGGKVVFASAELFFGDQTAVVATATSVLPVITT